MSKIKNKPPCREGVGGGGSGVKEKCCEKGDRVCFEALYVEKLMVFCWEKNPPCFVSIGVHKFFV